MCWIWIAVWTRLGEILKSQKDRWYDSIWVTNWKHILKRVFKEFDDYLKLLDEADWSDKLFLMHHRKATIWDINLNNAHPFKGKYFTLMQNWTSRTFYIRYKMHYRKETDSENLLCYIERATKKIEDIPSILEKLSKKIDDKFWNIIVTDGKKILFYTDGARESYVNIKWEKVVEITNYKNWLYWYNNNWFIIFDYSWNIFSMDMKDINTKYFYQYYTTTQNTCWVNRSTIYPYYDDYYDEIPLDRRLGWGDQTVTSIINWYYQDQYEEVFEWLFRWWFDQNLLSYDDYLYWRITKEELFNNYLYDYYGVVNNKLYKENYWAEFPYFVFEQALRDMKQY